MQKDQIIDFLLYNDFNTSLSNSLIIVIIVKILNF